MERFRLSDKRISLRAAAKLLIPLVIIGIGEYIFARRLLGEWRAFASDLIWFAVAAGLSAAFRGWWRDIMGWTAALMLCVAAAEGYAQYRLSGRLVSVVQPVMTTKDPVLAWRLGPAGRHHHVKIDPRTGQKVFDVEYTIAADHTRQVLSGAGGPTIVFLGDSLTFGDGLPDADTLPQAFADITGRRLRVLNLGVGGYGPQQFLRAFETGVYDDLLGRPHVLVFETAAWQADLTACVADWTMPQSRYLLVDGTAVFSGRCSDRWSWLIGRLFTKSMYSAYIAPVLSHPTAAKIDLYVAVMTRLAVLGREKFGAPTVLLYLSDPSYLAGSGITDEQIVARFRANGLAVVDGRLDPKDFPEGLLTIPGEGHPTGIANRARAALVLRTLGDLGVLPK